MRVGILLSVFLCGKCGEKKNKLPLIMMEKSNSKLEKCTNTQTNKQEEKCGNIVLCSMKMEHTIDKFDINEGDLDSIVRQKAS